VVGWTCRLPGSLFYHHGGYAKYAEITRIVLQYQPSSSNPASYRHTYVPVPLTVEVELLHPYVQKVRDKNGENESVPELESSLEREPQAQVHSSLLVLVLQKNLM
jgi:hypothetical protein